VDDRWVKIFYQAFSVCRDSWVVLSPQQPHEASHSMSDVYSGDGPDVCPGQWLMCSKD
jgi:hypothetical protein